MRRRCAAALAVAWLLATSVAAAAPARRVQAPVTAQLEPRSIAAGETAVLRVTVRTSGSRPEAWRLPALPAGLVVVSTRDASHIELRVPSGRSATFTREYVLRAEQSGLYMLPRIRITIGRATYETEPLQLFVRRAPPARGLDRPGQSRFALTARFAPDTVYVGQQTTLEAEASFEGGLSERVTAGPDYLPPNPPGFWVEDLRDGASLRTRITGARLVSETFRYRRAYFPLEPGRFTLAPARIAFDVRPQPFGRPVPREIASDSIELIVVPPPTRGRPASFNGAVGRLTLHASLRPARIPVGEAGVLRVEVAGIGNVRALPAPRIEAASGIELYAPTERATQADTAGLIRGSKVFEWVIVPQRAGPLQVGPVELAVFDPYARRYDLLRSAPLEALAVAAAGSRPAAAALPELRLRPAPAGGLDFVRTRIFAALQFVPLLFGLLLTWRRRRAGRERRPSRRALRSRLRHALRQLRREGPPAPEFFERLLHSFVSWLADRFAQPELRNAPPATIEAHLVRAGVEPALAAEVAALLLRIHSARFDPTGALNPQLAVRRTEVLAARLDRTGTWRRTAARGARSASAAILLAAGLMSAAAAGAQRADDAFMRGVAAYQELDFDAAAAAFQAHLRQAPRDGNAWLNLGLALDRRGQHGAAVWSWLGGLRQRPKDPAIRAALRQAGVQDDVVRRALPPFGVPIELLLLAASIAWLAGCGALVLRVHSRRTVYSLGGGLGLGLTLLVVLVILAHATRAPIGIVIAQRGVDLRSAPQVRATSLGRLEPGIAILVDDGRNTPWLRVRTLAGTQGWLETGQVRVVP
ncbi:MAG: BatD family protein [Longimicrobiales bacterium]